MKKRETFKTLFKNKKLSIKEITSPRSFTSRVFRQDYDEWVFIHQGSAHLEIAGKNIFLSKGEYCFIPRNIPHKVLKTSSKTETIWYAVYIK